MRKFPKVLNLGSRGIENILEDPIFVMEKLDGSQFRMVFRPDGTFDCGSHHMAGLETIDKMFLKGKEQTARISEELKNINFWKDNLKTNELHLYCEFFSKPKQNALRYDRIPKNNLYLFAGFTKEGDHMKFIEPKLLKILAASLEIEEPKVLGEGRFNPQELAGFIGEESFLGGTNLEGVVVYNFHKTYPFDLPSVASYTGFPLVGKHVDDVFKEVNEKVWADGRDPMAAYLTAERFTKVLQHLREDGTELVRENATLRYVIPACIQEMETEAIPQLKPLWIQRGVKEMKKRAANWAKQQWFKYLMEEGRVDEE